MLNQKEKYTVNIESVNNMGNGVTHIDGIVVFVPFAITGDVCHITIERLYSSYAIGKIENILSPSPYRTVPACPHFTICGGCDLLNLSLDKENEAKEEMVASVLKKFSIDAKTAKTVCPVSEKYRNKVVLYYGKGGFGYYKQGSNEVVPHNECCMNDPLIDEIVEFCVANLEKSCLRALFIRKSSHTEPQIMVSPIYSKKTDVINLASKLVNRFPHVHSVLLGVNKENDFVLEKTDFTTVYGNGYIEDEICGLKFRVSPKSFYQINHTCATHLYEKAVELLSAKEGESVADLFCGTGTMGMIVAKRTGAKVTGVEIEKSAVKDAKINAKINKINSVEFFADDAKNFDKSVDACIIDPPRKGCSKFMIDTLLRLKPHRIVYVSCNPDTMARDVKLLSTDYKIASNVFVFNMFPRTSHVESVVCLKRQIQQ